MILRENTKQNLPNIFMYIYIYIYIDIYKCGNNEVHNLRFEKAVIILQRLFMNESCESLCLNKENSVKKS